MRSIIGFGIEKSIDFTSLALYLQLNYIPAPFTMLEGVRKLLPGHSIRIKGSEVVINQYYHLPINVQGIQTSITQAKNEIKHLLENSVKQRLVADVPLGVFLSGGIDSSLITSIASRHKEDLNTFSIGYTSESYFDETKYARQVAEHFGTRHHAFRLSRNDLFEHVHDILEHMDEPFADSSAIPVYILSKLTRKHVTVALSGDGADEIFSGYNKHLAFLRSRKKSFKNQTIKNLSPLWKLFPRSRNNPVFNSFRQLDRYSRGLKKAGPARYWMWATLMEDHEAKKLIHPDKVYLVQYQHLFEFRRKMTSKISDSFDMNEILDADIRLVLPNDMLYKVDLMSMAFGLEVRVPFLDHRLVEAAMSLPSEYKISPHQQKIILREILSEYIPGKLAWRSKHGFEVPLLAWFRKELKSMIKEDLLASAFIKEQGIFNPETIHLLIKKLFSPDPGDTHAHIWAMIVFQSWWKKYFN